MAKRRAHGDGGLFVRGRGTDHERWVGRITLADGTRRDVYGRTQVEARRKLEELKRAASMGMRLTSVRQTTGEFLIDCREKQLVVVLGGHWLQGNLVTHALKSTDELALGANPVAFVEIRRA